MKNLHPATLVAATPAFDPDVEALLRLIARLVVARYKQNGASISADIQEES